MIGTIVNIKGFKAVGLTYFGDNNKGEIPALWEVFNKRYTEIKNKNVSMYCYGICDDDLDSEGRFHYTACAEVDSFEGVPAGMEAKEVPAGKYAVYTYSGPLNDLGDFYNSIFTRFMPEDGCEIDMRPQFELYDERYMQNGEFDIYMPVK